MSTIKDLAENKKTLLIEIHTLKNLPASHVNADDVGALKTMVFNGTERARISSQCLKNAWRKSETMKDFSNRLSGEEKSFRTRRLAELTYDYLISDYGYEDTDDNKAIVNDMIAEIVGSDKGVVCFVSSEDVQFLAHVIDQKLNESKESVKKNTDKKDSGKKYFKTGAIKKEREKFEKEYGKTLPAIISLFGRMSTSEAIQNVESSLSVAHSFSTYPIPQESDYFTAVEDILNGLDSGSGHLSETSFNSAVYYGYASFSMNQFCKNLEEFVTDEEYKKKAFETIIRALIETICLENPKTKKTSFASDTFPEAVYITVKTKNLPCHQGTAFADVFEKDDKILEMSIDALANNIDLINRRFPVDKAGEFWLENRYGVNPNTTDVLSSIEDIIKKVEECVINE